MKLNQDHVFISRSEKKSEGISEQSYNREGKYDKNFNFDGNITTNDLNYGLYKTVQNINRKVEYLFKKDQDSKEVSNESNPLKSNLT